MKQRLSIIALFCVYHFILFSEPSPPRFTVNHPPLMYVSAGSEVNMSCKASGFPKPVVIWYKDGIPVSKENTAGEKGMLELTFKSTTSGHQEEYWCEATNSHGWKRSSSTLLALKQSKLIFHFFVTISFLKNIQH